MTGLELRLLGYALLATALVGGWWYVGHLQDRAEAATRLEVAYSALVAVTRERERNAAETQTRYQAELDGLRAGRAAGARPIRVCDAPRPVPATGAAAGQSDGAAAPAGDVPAEPGRDLGPALYAEADRADELSAQIRALQDWIRREHPAPE